MFLSEVYYMCRLVLVFAQIVNIEVLTLVYNEEFAQSAHKSAIIRVQARASSFRIEIKKAPF